MTDPRSGRRAPRRYKPELVAIVIGAAIALFIVASALFIAALGHLEYEPGEGPETIAPSKPAVGD